MRKPFYKKSHKSWYVHHQGRMVKLAEDKDEAFQKYHELMANGQPAKASDSVASLCNAYLDWCQNNRADTTYEWYRHFLSSFVRSIGTRLSLEKLKPLHVSQWLLGTEWGQTTKSDATKALKRTFNWAVREGRIKESPIKTVEAPSPERREVYLQPEQFNLLLSHTTDEYFRDYLNFLHETGARPQEARVIEARHCQLDAGRIVLPTSQAKGKRAPRVIYLTPPAQELVSRLCGSHPQGAILRNSDGEAWNRSSVNCRFRRLRERLEKAGTPMDGICATSIRHGFATAALKNGVDPVTISILMGHTDSNMVANTYQHLAADATYLAQAMQRAKGQDAERTAESQAPAEPPTAPGTPTVEPH